MVLIFMPSLLGIKAAAFTHSLLGLYYLLWMLGCTIWFASLPGQWGYVNVVLGLLVVLHWLHAAILDADARLRSYLLPPQFPLDLESEAGGEPSLRQLLQDTQIDATSSVLFDLALDEGRPLAEL
jgi:hypothetical protein